MITIFQHGEDESVGEIGTFLEESGRSYSIVRLYETNEIPEKIPKNLIVLGGQMSVNDTREYPYFIREKEIIRNMVAARRPVFGICLGAQMIASAFGERVFPSTPEHGWCSVRAVHQENTSPFIDSCRVFHWHNETFNLPGRAILLLKGERVNNQAFIMGSAVGVQFHPEVTGEIISRWSEELGSHEREQVLRDSEREIAGNAQRCRILIDKFLNGWKN
jgi:GMP synthase-like glutamine amidotransferase